MPAPIEVLAIRALDGTSTVKLDHGWQQIVELSKPLREAVTEAALAAWEQRQ